MSERKFTDDEIINMLKHCIRCNARQIANCDSCPLENTYPNCDDEIEIMALDLINRQRAEIKRLQKLGASVTRRMVKVKAEANKELDKLKGVINLLARDIADRDKMLEGKVEEVYADFMRDYKEIRAELEDLLDSDALIPPVKIGQTVYAGIVFDDGDDTIEEYTVDGLAYIYGEWRVWCARDRDWYKYGTECCKPTREEAEAAIAAAKSAADIKDGHKNGGAE